MNSLNEYEKFGFEQSITFFNKYGNSPYVDPDKAGKEKNKMSKLGETAANARNNFISFAQKVASFFSDLEFYDCSMWQGNKGKGHNAFKDSFWIQLKNPKWRDLVQSVSLSFGKADDLDVWVDIKQSDKKIKSDPDYKNKVLRQQAHLIDLPLKNGLEFRTLTLDKYRRSAIYGEKDIDDLRNKLNGAENLPLVQVRTSVDSLIERESSGILLEAVINAVRLIKEYYDYVMSLDDNAIEEQNNKSQAPKFWLYSPGEQASNWDEFYESGIMGLGWDLIGDLGKYNSQNDIEKALKKSEDTKTDQLINAKALWQFDHVMKPGDVVFAKKGTGRIIGKGIVKSDYLFDDERTELKHVRKIDWTNKGEWVNPGSAIRKTLTELTPQEAEKLNTLFKDALQFKNDFSWMLYESKNLILRGAPGTGKSYLAKEIAADIITNGQLIDGKPIKFADLSDEQKKQVAFVQFHPNYDYSDFVEGLRPKINDDGTMGFELKAGIFKSFVAQARKNYEDSLKTLEDIEKETSVQELMMEFFSSIDFGKDLFKTISGTEFKINGIDDEHISIEIPENQTANKLSLRVDEVRKMLESDVNFTMIKDVTSFFGKTFATQAYSYDFAIYKAIKAKKANVLKTPAKQTELKKFVFIIDEINRGEISKIFGELFYSIDPGYRGRDGEIFTQYSNMHSDPNEKFYIPDNVYIIGTMNDIDRSVDSFDFAMRRRFRFVELKASEQLKMLDSLNDDDKEDAKHRMEELNKAIVKEKELNENYQIGAAYFLKLNYLGSDKLWTDYLEPLLHEYVRGMYDESDIMKRLAEAYGYKSSTEGDADESDQN